MVRSKNLRIVLFVLLAFFIIFGGIIVHGNVVSASAPEKEKIYTSVRINYGDSLWSIASDFCDESDDINDYIDDLKQMNHIKNERGLIAGNYLTVYYFE